MILFRLPARPPFALAARLSASTSTLGSSGSRVTRSNSRNGWMYDMDGVRGGGKRREIRMPTPPMSVAKYGCFAGQVERPDAVTTLV